MIRAILIFCLVFWLPGCAPRGALSYLPLPLVADETLQRVYVATNRNLRQINEIELVDQEFGGSRTPEIYFGRVDVSIPSGHEPGKVEWPRNARDLDPERVFLTRNGALYDTDRAFLQAMAKDTGGRGKNVLVFVHGYNVNNAEAMYRLAQIAHDFDAQSPVLAFSWASAGKTGAYVYDRDSVIFSRDGFESLLEALSRDGWRATVVAHSMGSQLVMETLRQMSIAGKHRVLNSLDGVALISPDIDEDVFVQQSQRIHPFPDPFLLLVSSKDKALEVSAWLTGKPTRLGSISSSNSLGDLPVDVIDLSNIKGGDQGGHNTAFSAPAAIAMLKKMQMAHTQR